MMNKKRQKKNDEEFPLSSKRNDDERINKMYLYFSWKKKFFFSASNFSLAMRNEGRRSRKKNYSTQQAI